MAKFERIPFDPGAWEKTLDHFPDRTIYQSSAWLCFLAESQKGEPLLAVLEEARRRWGISLG